MKRKPSPWPKNARCAVMLTFDFDAEAGWMSRDPSIKDRPGVCSQGTYGARVAVPRLLELLRAERVPATFFIPGWVAERHPNEAMAIKNAGHEIGHHGYLHERAEPADLEGERQAFDKGLKALDAVLGVAPLGYRAPGWDLTPQTLALVRRAGMIYSSNLMDDVYPYFHPGPGSPVVELPVQWTLDDAPFFLFHPRWMNRPIQSAETVYQIFRDEFTGAYGLGGLYDLTCHPQIIGQPSRLLMLRRLIRFMKKHDRVWWAQAHEIAEHWIRRRERGEGAR